MAKKIVWLLISCLMALSLVIASCGPAAIEEEEEEVVIEEEEEEEEEVVIEEEEEILAPGVAKYGGVHNRVVSAEPLAWDYGISRVMFPNMNMHGELTQGDWSRGPAAAKVENDWTGGFGGFMSMMTGSLATDWSLPDDETIVWTIREGIHWWDKAPANGREYTAEDAAWNLDRSLNSPLSYLYSSYQKGGKGLQAPVKVLPGNKIEAKVLAENQGLMLEVLSDFLWHICPEVVEKYGDASDWKNVVGTGAFMLTDFVPGSLMQYEKNPNYWMKDPLLGNQLPYMDGIKVYVIADKSTQLAAFRTGKVDMLSGPTLLWEDVDLLKEANPDLMVKAFGNASINMPWGRIDGDLPFKDIRVRRAMNIAVDQQAILDEYYGGYADILGWPYSTQAVFGPVYTALEDQPADVQELFEYDPAKAKALLAEAGYPDGFKTSIACSVQHSDFLSIIASYLADIGIEMELENLEVGAYNGVRQGATYKEMIYSNDYVGNAFRMMCVTSMSTWNYSGFYDERTETAAMNIANALGKDDSIVAKEMKEIGPFTLQQALPIMVPSPNAFVIWWPWLQNFYGATGGGSYFSPDEYINYCWVDEPLKKSMGY